MVLIADEAEVEQDDLSGRRDHHVAGLEIARGRMRVLRLQLPADDQSLLLLRIDKGLSWNELALVFSGQTEAMQEAEMARAAARLRQRFAAIKRRLKVLAREEGLI